MAGMNIKEKYDEISLTYDTIYENDLFWKISNEITFEFINKYINDDVNIIDIGCGTGEFGAYYYSRGYSVDFCDISPKMLKEAEKNIYKLREIGIINEITPKFIELDLTSAQLVLPTEYDVIIMEGDVLGYCLEKDSEVLKKLSNQLKANGFIFVGVDNLMLDIIETSKMGDLVSINTLLNEAISRCPFGLPIKKYTPKTFEEILPSNLRLIDYIGKPAITPYISYETREVIQNDKNLYDILLIEERDVIEKGYSEFGSHFTFALKKIG